MSCQVGLSGGDVSEVDVDRFTGSFLFLILCSMCLLLDVRLIAFQNNVKARRKSNTASCHPVQHTSHSMGHSLGPCLLPGTVNSRPS